MNVFTSAPLIFCKSSHAGQEVKPLHLQMYQINSGKQRVSVIIAGKPFQAGIDPRNLLVVVDIFNNLKTLKVAASKVNKAIVLK